MPDGESTHQTASIDITVGYFYEPSGRSGFPGLEGGIRISADGLVLTGPSTPYTGETEHHYSHTGEEREQPAHEFYGDWLNFNVDNLQDALRPFLDGTADRHREYVAHLRGESITRLVVFSHLDGERVRIAAKSRHDEYSEYVPLEAMVGAAVDPVAVARELIGCRESIIEYVGRAFEDHDPDLSDEIEQYQSMQREKIDELRDCIDDQNPDGGAE